MIADGPLKPKVFQVLAGFSKSNETFGNYFSYGRITKRGLGNRSGEERERCDTGEEGVAKTRLPL